jgi:alcohol dehydrogenase YqhD (iron-dependent ADH family)
MFDFIFQNPTKIIFGRGKEALIGDELAAAGVRKVLFVYGTKSIKKSGLYDRVIASLQTNSIRCLEHGGVVSNPVLSHCRDGILLTKIEQFDAVLAVGGGSVIDEAKAIAVGAKAGHDLWEYFTGKEVEAALPVFTILTLAATGSEMNGNAVITNEETKQKFSITSPHIFPKVSILNPELTCTVPPSYSAYGAVDAIAHVLEAYFTKTPGQARLQDRLVEGIVRTVIETTDRIMENPEDYEARAQFMWAATLALNGITPAGVGDYNFPNHMMEHSLSALYGLAHGAGLAIVLPAWMKWYSNRNADQFKRFAGKIFGLEDGEKGIAALEQWFSAMKAPIRLPEVNIQAEDIDDIAANAEKLAILWGIADTYPKKTIADILRLAL